MKAIPKQVIYYKTLDGKVPYALWYSEIKDMRLKQAVDKRLERVKNGNYGDCETVGDGLLELRFRAFGARIYFVEIGDVIVLLFCAGDKSSQFQRYS